MSDVISRQAAIEYYRVTDPHGTFVTCSSIIDFLEELPSADPRWIPMTDRKPEVGQDVLVTTDNREMLVVTYANMAWTQGHCFHWKPNFMGTEYLDEKHVIAWMPLPEPYQEGRP